MEHSETSAGLATARLRLRTLLPGDAPAIAAGIGDWAVTRWLITPPWPYGLGDAEWFIADAASEGAHAILVDDQLAGVVQIDIEGELGYWLAPHFHGRGYMTEAVRALVARHFSGGGGPVWSGYLIGNAASCNVLTKIGFRNTEIVRKPSHPLNRQVDVQRMALVAENFHAITAWEARSARLTFRPMQPSDTDALHALHSDWSVVRQLGSWPWPPQRDFAATRAQPFGGIGFVWGVFLDRALIGSFGLTDGIVGYSLAAAHWGKGFGAELLTAALNHGFSRFPLEKMTAEAWADNTASLALLRRMAFREVGRTVEMSKARRVETGLVHFVLTRADWLARPAGHCA